MCIWNVRNIRSRINRQRSFDIGAQQPLRLRNVINERHRLVVTSQYIKWTDHALEPEV
jgi:hypothetical protein